MVQSNEKVVQESAEANEIDRIMKEIEDLEKQIQDTDKVSKETQAAPEQEGVPQMTPMDTESGKIVPLHVVRGNTESLAESDAVLAPTQPLAIEREAQSSGGLSLKIGSLADVSLEFSRANMVVTLSCTKDELTISTSQGAQFRLPFNAK